MRVSSWIAAAVVSCGAAAVKGDLLADWVAQESERHAALGVYSPLGNGTILPMGCNFTLPNNTAVVSCVANADSNPYDPLRMAAGISAVRGVKVLSFAVDVAPDGAKELNDVTLLALAANLNSSTVTTLHVFLGELENVTSAGIASFTALNPTVSCAWAD